MVDYGSINTSLGSRLNNDYGLHYESQRAMGDAINNALRMQAVQHGPQNMLAAEPRSAWA